MKKILFFASLMVFVVCCANAVTVEEHDADFVGCQRVDTTEEHLVYKCPSDMEWIVNLKNSGVEPSGLFYEGGNLNWEEINADIENTYIEVVLIDSNGCKEDFHYRTMIKPFNIETKEPFAVSGCK